MMPLFGRESYDELRRANAWTAAFLPNASGAPSDEHWFARPPLARLKAWAEWSSRSVFGRALEAFEARRKMHRFNETDALKGPWTKSTRESHSLQDRVRQDIETAWRRRVDALTGGD